MLEVNLKYRLLLFIEHENISVSEFERRCGLSHGYVSHIRRSISDSVCTTIAQQFKNLDTRWLKTGEGSMLLDDNKEYDADISRRYEEMLQSRDARIRQLETTVIEQERLLVEMKRKIKATQQ